MNGEIFQIFYRNSIIKDDKLNNERTECDKVSHVSNVFST